MFCKRLSILHESVIVPMRFTISTLPNELPQLFLRGFHDFLRVTTAACHLLSCSGVHYLSLSESENGCKVESLSLSFLCSTTVAAWINRYWLAEQAFVFCEPSTSPGRAGHF
jgi:hypothetical protein